MQKKKLKILRLSILVVIILISLQTVLFAHSGKTDANGGHKDNKNKSGLGSYHYHCGGNPPHLHQNGVCPYKSSTSNSTSSSSSSKTNSSKSSTSSKSTSQSTSVQSTQNENTTKSTIKENAEIEVTSVQIKNKEKEKVKFKIGEILVLQTNVEPNNASNKKITWSSSNTNIATVSSDGKVEAIKEGTVKIIAKSNNGKEDSIELTIEKPIIEVNRIVLDKNNICLNEGEIVKITELVYPIDATDKNVKWESSDENIATVEDGKVTAIKEGGVTITVSSNNGIKSICSINVRAIKKEDDIEKNTNIMFVPATLGALTITGGGAGIGYLAYKRKK